MTADDPHLPGETPLLIAARVAVTRWEEELATLERRRDGILQKLEAARSLLALLAEEDVSVSEDLSEQLEAQQPSNTQASADPELTAPLPDVPPDAPWIDAVRTWIHSAPLGIGYPRLRAMMERTPGFESRFQQSEKGYYNAIGRLAGRQEIIKYNNRLYSPEALVAFKGEVDLGKIDDDRPVNGAYSPMGEAILDIVGRSAKTGILGKDILLELRKDQEFDATLTPHHSGAYNIIARLVKRKQILRRDDGLCFPGIKFPPRNPLSKWCQDPAPAPRPDLRIVGGLR
jgi:hypothetical protein